MADAPKYMLQLRSLKFISAVDRPAQPHAVAAIIKSADKNVTATFQYAKTDAKLGIVIGWALTSKVAGQPHFDLQGDHISEADLVKIAYEYVTAEKGASDEQHDELSTGQCVFMFPLTTEIGKALGLPTDQTGLIAGIKVSADVLAKFELPDGSPGKLTGWSIGGAGERTPLSKTGAPPTAPGQTCTDCGTMSGAASNFCPGCGTSMPKKKNASPFLTQPPAAASVALVPTTEKTMTPEMIAELNAKLKNAVAYGELNDTQKAYHARLPEASRPAFLAKSSAERAAETTTAIVHKTATGEVFFNVDDQRLVEQIKRTEALEKSLATQTEVGKAAVYIAKATLVMGELTGDEATAVACVKAITEGIADEKVRTAVFDMIKSGNAAAEMLTKASGTSQVSEQVMNAEQGLYVACEAFAKANAKPYGTSVEKAVCMQAFKVTPEGMKLYTAYTKAMPSPANAANAPH